MPSSLEHCRAWAGSTEGQRYSDDWCHASSHEISLCTIPSSPASACLYFRSVYTLSLSWCHWPVPLASPSNYKIAKWLSKTSSDDTCLNGIHDITDIIIWHIRTSWQTEANLEEFFFNTIGTASYTPLRAHATVLDIVCWVPLETKKEGIKNVYEENAYDRNIYEGMLRVKLL